MRVLLVEDDTNTARASELMLQAESFIVDSTNLGEDGLKSANLRKADIISSSLMLRTSTVASPAAPAARQVNAHLLLSSA